MRIVFVAVLLIMLLTLNLTAQPSLSAYLDQRTLAVIQAQNLGQLREWLPAREFFKVLCSIVRQEHPNQPDPASELEKAFAHPLVKLMSQEVVVALVPLEKGNLGSTALLAMARVKVPALPLVKAWLQQARQEGDVTAVQEGTQQGAICLTVSHRNKENSYWLVHEGTIILSNQLSLALTTAGRMRAQQANFTMPRLGTVLPQRIGIYAWLNCEPLYSLAQQAKERLQLKNPVAQFYAHKIIDLFLASSHLTARIEVQQGVQVSITRHLQKAKTVPWKIYRLPFQEDPQTVAGVQVALPFKEIFSLLRQNVMARKPQQWQWGMGILSGLCGGYDFEQEILPMLGEQVGLLLRSAGSHGPDFPQLVAFLQIGPAFDVKVRPAWEALITAASLEASKKNKTPLLWKRYQQGALRITALHMPGHELGKVVHPAMTYGQGHFWLLSEEKFCERLAQPLEVNGGDQSVWLYLHFGRLASLLDHYRELIISNEIRKGYRPVEQIRREFQILVQLLRSGEKIQLASRHQSRSDCLELTLLLK